MTAAAGREENLIYFEIYRPDQSVMIISKCNCVTTEQQHCKFKENMFNQEKEQ